MAESFSMNSFSGAKSAALQASWSEQGWFTTTFCGERANQGECGGGVCRTTVVDGLAATKKGRWRIQRGRRTKSPQLPHITLVTSALGNALSAGR